MSKFHVTDKGEAGQCRAEKGGCPFGGDAQHYSSPEVARQAYELSMAGEQFATVTKKPTTEKVVKAAEKLKNTLDERLGRNTDQPLHPNLPLSREDFDPALHEGFEYDQVFYDEAKRRKEIAANIERRFPRESDAQETVRKWLNSDYQQWRREARTEKAKSFEKNVPIRLIPTGSKVEVSQHTADRYSNKAYRAVGRPVEIEGSGEIVGRYRDSMNEWDYVQPETTFNLGYVDPDKKIDSHWSDKNHEAERLAIVRSAYTETDRSQKLTKENYEAVKWGGIPLAELKFDQQAVLDQEANRGSSELGAREAVVRAKRIWDSKSRTEIASPNEDGVPMRLIPVGAEVAVSRRRYDGTVDVGTVIAPSIKEDGSIMGRVKTKAGIVEFSPGTLHNVGFFEEGKKLSPRWKFSNEMAGIVKEQRSRVEEFEQNKK